MKVFCPFAASDTSVTKLFTYGDESRHQLISEACRFDVDSMATPALLGGAGGRRRRRAACGGAGRRPPRRAEGRGRERSPLGASESVLSAASCSVPVNAALLAPAGDRPLEQTVYDIRQPRPVHFSELHFDRCEECVSGDRSVNHPAFIYVVVLVW